jgi:hypothetical protein
MDRFRRIEICLLQEDFPGRPTVLIESQEGVNVPKVYREIRILQLVESVGIVLVKYLNTSNAVIPQNLLTDVQQGLSGRSMAGLIPEEPYHPFPFSLMFIWFFRSGSELDVSPHSAGVNSHPFGLPSQRHIVNAFRQSPGHLLTKYLAGYGIAIGYLLY